MLKRIGGMMLLLILIGGVFLFIQKEPTLTGKSITEELSVSDQDPLSLAGFRQVDIKVTPGKVLMGDNCTAVVVTTTLEKTQSIEEGVLQKVNFRPNQYDLIVDIFDGFDIQPLFIKITALNDELFRADLLIERENKIVSLDAKPSDAFAIAARFKTDVYMEETLFNKLSQKIC